MFVQMEPVSGSLLWAGSSALHGLLYGVGELVCAGSILPSAEIAFQNADQLFRFHSFAELGDGFEVSVAAADKGDVPDCSVIQIKVDFRGTHVVRIVRIMHFQFNIHEIDDDYDVFVAFETMNNRGKELSTLELLKNRLIYLSTLYSFLPRIC